MYLFCVAVIKKMKKSVVRVIKSVIKQYKQGSYCDAIYRQGHYCTEYFPKT